MEILRVENLVKEYGEGEIKVRALDDVSFSVEKGEFVSVIGPYLGCGRGLCYGQHTDGLRKEAPRKTW